MNWPQHSLGGAAAGAVYMSLCSVSGTSLLDSLPAALAIPAALSVLPAAVFGASLPDIDKAGSHVSNRHPLISALIRPFTKHRGMTHSLVALGVIILLGELSYRFLYTQAPYPALAAKMYLWAVASGFFSHQILDLITTEGIVAFWPFTRDSIHFAYLSPERDGWWVMILSVLITALFTVLSIKALL